MSELRGVTPRSSLAESYAFVRFATWIAVMLGFMTLPAPVDWHWSSAFPAAVIARPPWSVIAAFSLTVAFPPRTSSTWSTTVPPTARRHVQVCVVPMVPFESTPSVAVASHEPTGRLSER